MNSYNEAFKKRIDKAGLAMQHLIKQGCAITRLHIDEKSTVINILPPPNSKVKGNLITINGGLAGRQYLMATRLYNCTVQWETTHQQNQEAIA